MKNYIILFLSLLASSTITAQSFFQLKGNGNVITKERDVNGSFYSIEASNGLDVYITPGDVASISVEADENLHEAIVTDIKNGKLEITTKKNIGKSRKKKIHVTYADELRSLHVSAGAEIETRQTLKAKELDLLSKSGGELELEVFSEYITANASSGGEIELKGKSVNLDAEASSGGDIEAKHLQVLHANVKASSGGSIDVNAKETLKANASSGGEVKYYGEPTEKNIQASFSGRIKSKR